MNVAELKKFKESLYSSQSRDLAEFEKNFLLIAIGILAFSITFIKDIVTIEDANYLIILFGGWILIISSIGIILFTFLKSSEASDKIFTMVDKFIIKNKLFKNEEILSDELVNEIKSETDAEYYRYKKLLTNLRRMAVISFLLGIFVFSIFVSINLIEENKSTNKVESKSANTTIQIIKN